MKVVLLPPEGLRIGKPIPFSLRDQEGTVLLARGATIANANQLSYLRSRPLFIDMTESEQYQRAFAGQLDEMVRKEVMLGKIANASPDYDALAALGKPDVGPLIAWPDLQMRLRLLLAEPRGADWIPRLRALRDAALAQARRQPDASLLRLVFDAGADFRDYSARHALFVTVLAALAAPHVPGWRSEWEDALTMAALTMNLSITTIQDDLACQALPVSPAQRAVLDTHPERSAQQLARLGVTDPLWLEAVRHHHDAPSGELDGRSPAEVIARLVMRTDRYTARLSPRRARKASSATAAAQTAFLDEGGRQDQAGSALVKVLGLYPPGSWVKLANGEVALVICRSHSPKAPRVASLVNRDGMPLSLPTLRNTVLKDFVITAAVPPGQVNVRPNLDALAAKIG